MKPQIGVKYLLEMPNKCQLQKYFFVVMVEAFSKLDFAKKVIIFFYLYSFLSLDRNQLSGHSVKWFLALPSNMLFWYMTVAGSSLTFAKSVGIFQVRV